MHTNLNNSDKKQIKDEGLRISKVEPTANNTSEFMIYLERPYYNGNRMNSEIVENTYINLHTLKSISFTKGMVLKKHLIIKENVSTKADQEEEEDDDSNMLDE